MVGRSVLRGLRVAASLTITACVCVLATCAPVLLPFESPGRAHVIRTAGPNESMIYLVRTEVGIVLVDLGWAGAASALRQELKTLDVDSMEVVAVFLTHVHRDHIAAWTVVPHARFYVGAGDEPFLYGGAEYEAWLVEAAETLKPARLPERGALEVVALERDTAIVVGQDTVRVFRVPGHTPGSTAFLVDGVLLVGDAVARRFPVGLVPARPVYSEDAQQARESLRSLFERIEDLDVRYLCTAHARCERYTPEVRRLLDRKTN